MSFKTWIGTQVLSGLVLAHLASVPVWAAFEFRPAGARAGGLGDTLAAGAGGAETVFWNPASVAWSQGVSVTGEHQRPFGMGQMETQALGIVVPVGKGVVGMSYTSYGFSLYTEQTVGLTYGIAFSRRLGLGLSVRGMQVAVAGLAGGRWVVFDIGVRACLTRSVTWGLFAWNAGGERVGLLGQGGAVGLEFRIAPGTALLVDVQKESGAPTGVSAGLEYEVIGRIALRIGAGGHPERLAAGIGVFRGRLTVDYAASYHTVLGISHRVSVSVWAAGPTAR